MNKAHSNIDWKNHPSMETPINEQNLNNMDKSIDLIDDRVIALDTTKFNVADAQGLVKSLTFNRVNGVFTVTYFDGSAATIDTMLEKLAVNFDFDEANQQLIIILDDGTEKRVDLSAFIAPIEFIDSGTIAFQLLDNGKVSAIVKEGSIEEKHLRPNYLADVKVEVAKAEASAKSASDSADNAAYDAKLAQSYAVGGSGIREGEDDDNAKKYKELAETSATNAAASETAAGEKAAEAEASAEAAGKSEANVKESENNAKASEDNAKTSETNAATSAGTAENAAENAAKSADTASKKADEAADSATQSQNYATGATDSAKYYYEQTKHISQGGNGLVPMGSVYFDALPTEDIQTNAMYNIKDDFVSDERFVDGGGKFYGAGSNIFYTVDGLWDVLASSNVVGIKGDAETEYRQGFVNITAEDIGLTDVENADTVDGFHASDFLGNGTGYKYPKKSNVDLNTLTEEWHGTIANATNAPTGATMGFLHVALSAEGLASGIPQCTQIFIANVSDGTVTRTAVFARMGMIMDSNVSWSAWRNISDGGNADKLDGYDANNLPISTMQQEALDGKVSKSGDTVNGNLSVTGDLNALNIIYSRHLDGSTANGWSGELYLNYWRQGVIFLGNGGYKITDNGANYNGKSTYSNYLQSANYPTGHYAIQSYYDANINKFVLACINNNPDPARYDVMVDYATKSERDGNGKVIADTYLPSSGGTLRGDLYWGYSNGWRMQYYSSNYFYNRCGAFPGNLPGICMQAQSDGTSSSGGGNGYFNLMPVPDGKGFLGYQSSRWNQIFAINTSISTSDRRLKKDISYIGEDSEYDTSMPDEQLEQLILGIKPVVFRRTEGESGRPHHGLIAQDFEELMKQIGLSDHAGFIKSPKTKDVEIEKEVTKEDGTTETVKEVKQEEIEGEYIYGFRYEELITDVIRFAQIQKKKADEMEGRLERLERLVFAN